MRGRNSGSCSSKASSLLPEELVQAKAGEALSLAVQAVKPAGLVSSLHGPVLWLHGVRILSTSQSAALQRGCTNSRSVTKVAVGPASWVS